MSNETLNVNFQNKIFNFIKKNLKIFIILLIFITIFLFSFLFYKNLQEKNSIKLSEQYTQASILLNQKKLDECKLLLESIINKGHKFYSPLALYLMINNNVESDPLKIISYFDQILKINSIDKENLNLIKIKKTIFLFNIDNEELIIKTLNPVINSNSVWKNMAIKLISDYFLSKNQKSKADEYIQLLNKKTNE